eukprot:12905737-Prorocentrum_lima.AAC.1
MQRDDLEAVALLGGEGGCMHEAGACPHPCLHAHCARTAPGAGSRQVGVEVWLATVLRLAPAECATMHD